MVERKKTVIEGELISHQGQFDDLFRNTMDYDFVLFIKEKTTNDFINVRYGGRGKEKGAYYHNFQAYIFKDRLETNLILRLTIEGELEEEKLEYRGTGLIKILSETKEE